MAAEEKPQNTDTAKTDTASAARPIIVKHAPILKEPLAEDTDESKPSDKPESTLAHATSSKVIQPPEHAEESEPEKSKTKPQAEEPAEKVEKDEPVPEKPAEPKADEEPAQSEAEEAASAAEKSKEAASSDAAKAKAAEELAASGTYKLDISESNGGSGTWLIALSVLTVLVIASAYLAVDAEILKLDITLPYEFIG